jgi:SPP1 gp7 family putative phage head morphogenesis protein
MQELHPIKETTEDYEKVERAIKLLFKREIYLPLIAALGLRNKNVLKNAPADALLEAIKFGRVQFAQGVFAGKFNAGISKRLREMGAKWSPSDRGYRILKTKLPYDVQYAVSASESYFQTKLEKIDQLLAKLVPAKIADKLKVSKFFDSSLWKVQKDFKKSLKNITVAPDLTDAARTRISEEWETNMKLWIQGWTEEEIKKLRQEMKKTIFAGNRYESSISAIQKSYGVSERKAKFLARQETGLLMAKFKETRYTDAGINEYKWGCVVGSPKHPVRPMHKALEGKIFRWDNPPITSPTGDRNNPGQDYGCRCFARPVVRFK